jgi:hypothetical protein
VEKLVIIMGNYSFDARANCMREGKSLNDFLANKANVIDDNGVILDATSYYNGDKLE